MLENRNWWEMRMYVRVWVFVIPESERIIVVWTNGSDGQGLSGVDDEENSLGGGGNSIESDSSDENDSLSSSLTRR